MEKNKILQEGSPEQIALALDANKLAFGALLGTLPQAVFHEEPGLAWFETGIAHDVFNGVLQTRLSPQEQPAAIERVLTHFRTRRLPFHWHLGPASQAPEIGDLLAAHGIEHAEDEPGMLADLQVLQEDAPAAPELAIQRVLTVSQVDPWSRTTYSGAPEEPIRHVFTAYSGLPLGLESPLRLYLGLLDGKPVATVALFFAAGVAAVERVVTVYPLRRRGIGAMMTYYAMQEARRAGYRFAVLSASPMGVEIYRRLGFQECCVVRTYEWNPSD